MGPVRQEARHLTAFKFGSGKLSYRIGMVKTATFEEFMHDNGLKQHAAPESRLEELSRRLSSLAVGSSRDRTVVFFTLCYLFVVLFRPQDLPGLGWIGTIRTPIVFGIIVFFIWLANGRRFYVKPLRITFFILVFEGLRGIVGYFFDPNNTIVRNEAWQFHIWRDIAVYFISFMLPLSTGFSSSKALSRVFGMIAVCAGFLGLYAITHSGKGPGGSVGDENDLCFVLLLYLPICGIMFTEASGVLKRLFFLGMFALSFGGMVATSSRGGMLGLFAMMGYLFVRSKRKLAMVAGVLAMVIVSVPFVPQTYWDEMFSIKTDIQQTSGTVEERYESWKVAWAIFIHPRNIPFGVGLQNTPWVFAEYERNVRIGVSEGKSLAGRSVHSTFFQLLADMGLYGVLSLGWLIALSFQSCSEAAKGLYHRMSRLRALSLEDHEEELERSRRMLLRHAKFAVTVLTALCYAWVGGGVSAMFISVLYYPQIWIMVGLSAAAAAYGSHVSDAVDLWYDEAEDGNAQPTTAPTA